MKRLIYLTYLGLLALMLISCDKENVAPVASNEFASLDNQRTGGSCPNYSYQTKAGTVQLGTVRGDYAIVGFKPNTTSALKQIILSQYNIFDATNGNAFFVYGDGAIEGDIVKFNAGTSCNQVEDFINQLERNPNVSYVLPVFDDALGFGYTWISSSPIFTVSLSSPQHYNFLKQFVKNTKTVILANYDNLTFVIGVDKKSTGNVWELCSILNASPKIDFAEPNFYGEFPSGVKHGRKMSDAMPNIKYN